MSIFLVAGVVAADDYPLKREFDVQYGGKLIVDTDRGSINIKTTKKKVVVVEITRKVLGDFLSDSDEILADWEIDFDQSGGDVRIIAKSRSDWNWFGWISRPLRVHFDILVPEQYNLDLKTSGGGVEIADLEGDVKCKTSGGRLVMDQIKGDIVGQTSGGSITLDGSDGTVDLRTSGGGIHIGKVAGKVDAHTSGGSVDVEEAGGDVRVSTSGGSIHVNEVRGSISASTSGGSVSATITEQPKNDCSLTSSGGGIRVYLAKGIQLEVDAKTSGGGVRCDMPIIVQGLLGKNQVRGSINGGGPELYLRTSGGPIKILGL
ncbi:hypothetical protein ACFL6Q_01370 [Candidatus Neomarinimicrobiota bacterium]